MRKYEGLFTEEQEKYLNKTKDMDYFELMESWDSNPEIINETSAQKQDLGLTVEEICAKYGCVDMTSFFASHGSKNGEEMIIITLTKVSNYIGKIMQKRIRN